MKPILPRLERKDDNGLASAMRAAIQPVMAAFDEFKGHQEARVAELEEKNDRLLTAMRRGSAGNSGDDRREPTIDEKAFNGFMRYGADALPDDERKALVVGDNTAGGYLAPEQFAHEVIKNLVLFSPVRAAARIGSMTGSDILIPKRTGAPTAHWVGETETRQRTQSSYGQLRLTAREAACYVDVSLKLLEDAAFSVEGEIAMDLAEEFGRLEGQAFVLGDGINKPNGIMNDPGIPAVPSDSAAAVTADGLIDALYALAPYYRNRSAWMLNSTTLASVRKLKDENGQYIWQPGIAAGQPETILGRPVIEAPDMPNEGAGTYPVVVGDFQSGYRIMDRVGFQILRDPFTQAENGLVRFHARRRVAGDVAKAEAFRKLQCVVA